jgi:hypothetical protein
MTNTPIGTAAGVLGASGAENDPAENDPTGHDPGGSDVCANPDCLSDAAEKCGECGRSFCLGHTKHPDHVAPH